MTPLYWVSLRTNNKFEYSKYSNIEEARCGYLPLPLDEYPYTLEYEPIKIPLWKL